ncbi:MAG: hypothetical protein QXS54_11880 [Candidatus Methanomethylicaceae archaeon]
MGLRFDTRLTGRVWSVSGDRVIMIVSNGRVPAPVEVRGVPVPPSLNEDVTYDCVVTVYPRRGGAGYAYTVWHRDAPFVAQYQTRGVSLPPSSSPSPSPERVQSQSGGGRRG